VRSLSLSSRERATAKVGEEEGACDDDGRRVLRLALAAGTETQSCGGSAIALPALAPPDTDHSHRARRSATFQVDELLRRRSRFSRPEKIFHSHPCLEQPAQKWSRNRLETFDQIFYYFSSWGGTKVGRRDPCLSPPRRRRWRRAPPSGIFHWAEREMVLLIPGAYQIARADGFTFRRKIACTRSQRALSTGRVLHQEVGCRSNAYLGDKTSRLILNVLCSNISNTNCFNLNGF
jgi:hypothetical protein